MNSITHSLTWPGGRQRSLNNAFSVLYEPRREPGIYKIMQKSGPKPKTDQSARAKTIAALRDNTASPFCTPLSTHKDSDKTARIKGKL